MTKKQIHDIKNENERIRTDKLYNLKSFDKDRAKGYYQMPMLKKVDYVPNKLIGFNYMLSTNQNDVGIHFYLDDYQFERVWSNPQKYVEKLKEFECVLTPDYSLYLEMPIAMMIWNVYRSRLIGQMCQDNGMIVIPTVSWAEPDTFEFCFDGLPENSTLSISTVGIKKNKKALEIWKYGVDELIKRKTPERLLIYGGKVDYDYGNIEVVYYKNEVTERLEERRNQDGRARCK